MYCDRCGSSVSPGARFCANCGKELAPAGAQPSAGTVQTSVPAQGAAVYDGRVQNHVQTLALLWCLNGVLRLIWVFGVYTIGLAAWPWIGHNFAGHFPFGSWPLLGFSWLWGLPFLAFFGFVHLLLAWSLYERKPWARTLGLIVAFLALFRFPLGTALGIYTIWVLLPESSGREYDRLAQAAA